MDKVKKKPIGWRRRVSRLLLLVAVGYVLFGCTMMGIQERLIFPRDVPGQRSPAAPVPPGWEQLTITAEDGSVVPAWLQLPARSEGERVPAVVFCHGNAELIDDLAMSDLVEAYRPLGVAVLLVEYRGYGRAGGEPSEKAIVSDAVKFYDLLAARPEIDPTRMVIHGRSLGGGVACGLARQRPPRAMVLQSTFTSMRAMAASMWLPGFIVRHPFRNDEVLATLDAPVLFMHGKKDDIIPYAHSERMVGMCKHSGRLVFQECSHNDFPADFEAYRKEIAAFLRQSGVVR